MLFIVKFFPEITIKSKPVRRQMVNQLARNVRRVLRPIQEDIGVRKGWDKLLVDCPGEGDALRNRVADALARISGIAYALEVLEFPLGDFDDILERVASVYGERLGGQTFAVRCKRAGLHEFRSVDIERYVGGGLNRRFQTAGVDLRQPGVTVEFEIRDKTLFVVKHRYPGLGGFPLGCLDPVLSLVSGGFDSTVASYLMMKRGMRTHFCFFNLGGRDHEIGVKEVALYLWMKFGSAQHVRFITVPFEDVVAELLNNVEDSQMGVILKRMMLRAAEALADRFDIDAIVTGESVAQVSSQTVRNLAVIDSVTDKLVLRPLIATDKAEIIRTAAAIGTEDFAAAMPEYCGVISVNPTTRARPDRVAAEEQHFDLAIIERAVAAARVQDIEELADEELERCEVEVLATPLADSVVIDIRHPSEEELHPLDLAVEVLRIPFYELHGRAAELKPGCTYMLYCDRGVISRLHAAHLVDSGHPNIKVYRPRP